jgi:hypothetical protein
MDAKTRDMVADELIQTLYSIEYATRDRPSTGDGFTDGLIAGIAMSIAIAANGLDDSDGMVPQTLANAGAVIAEGAYERLYC